MDICGLFHLLISVTKTYTGSILVSVNPYKPLPIYSREMVPFPVIISLSLTLPAFCVYLSADTDTGRCNGMSERGSASHHRISSPSQTPHTGQCAKPQTTNPSLSGAVSFFFFYLLSLSLSDCFHSLSLWMYVCVWST